MIPLVCMQGSDQFFMIAISSHPDSAPIGVYIRGKHTVGKKIGLGDQMHIYLRH